MHHAAVNPHWCVLLPPCCARLPPLQHRGGPAVPSILQPQGGGGAAAQHARVKEVAGVSCKLELCWGWQSEELHQSGATACPSTTRCSSPCHSGAALQLLERVRPADSSGAPVGQGAAVVRGQGTSQPGRRAATLAAGRPGEPMETTPTPQPPLAPHPTPWTPPSGCHTTTPSSCCCWSGSRALRTRARRGCMWRGCAPGWRACSRSWTTFWPRCCARW